MEAYKEYMGQPDALGFEEAMEIYEKITAQVAEADNETAMQRYVSLRLRSTDGLSEDAFKEHFGRDLPTNILQSLEKAEQKGLLTAENKIYKPTLAGLFASETDTSR